MGRIVLPEHNGVSVCISFCWYLLVNCSFSLKRHNTSYKTPFLQEKKSIPNLTNSMNKLSNSSNMHSVTFLHISLCLINWAFPTTLAGLLLVYFRPEEIAGRQSACDTALFQSVMGGGAFKLTVLLSAHQASGRRECADPNECNGAWLTLVNALRACTIDVPVCQQATCCHSGTVARKKHHDEAASNDLLALIGLPLERVYIAETRTIALTL